MQVITEPGSRPIKIWTDDVEPPALEQLKNIAKLPFIDPHGVGPELCRREPPADAGGGAP